MEKIVAKIGFGIFYISFLLCICVGTGWIYGAIAGLVVTLFGLYYMED